MTRNGNGTLNAGTFAPKKYVKYTVTYSTDGLTATYSYFGTSTATVPIAVVEIECDAEFREIRGELLG